MKNKLLYSLIFLAINSIFAQTNVSGGLFSNTTWGISGSPYIVTSDIVLFPGYVLTIEPGVIVKFNSGKKLTLRGTLNSLGTAENKITFTSNSNSPSIGQWKGIEIENDQGGKIIASNIIGEYADNFIRIMEVSSDEIININNSEIKNNNIAIYGHDGPSNHTLILDKVNINNNGFAFLYAQNATITNCIFSNGERGIQCWDTPSNIFISNSEFYNLSVYAIGMVGGEIDNCHIHNNAVGVAIGRYLIVKNSTIDFNKIGMQPGYTFAFSGANVFNNKIYNSTQYNFKHLYSYPFTISNNYWGTTIQSEISQKIFDAYDDPSLGIVTFTPYSDTLNIEDYSSIKENNLNFYPNPANSEIILSNDSIKKYEIYLMNGVLIKKGTTTKFLNITDLNNGLYLMKISNLDESEFSISKLIKQ